MMETLLQRIVETGSEIAIIDITGVPTVDTLTAQHLLKTVAAIRMMGADCIISGIRPQIAQTIVGGFAWRYNTRNLGRRLVLGPQAIGPVGREEQQLSAHTTERIPILRLGRFLLVSIQIEMDDRIAIQLQEDLTALIEKTGARGVLIDISSLEVVDSFIGRMIGNISAMSQILNAHTVVVGIQPAVAITLVELGITFAEVRTALNVERGMEILTGIENSENRGDE
jgi:rsbT antagonist protein RsbS